MIRDGKGLQEALEQIEKIESEEMPHLYCASKDRIYNREWLECLQVENLLLVLKAIALGARERSESRGSHYRRDYPKINNQEWLKNIVIHHENDRMKVSIVPVITTRYPHSLEDR